MLAKTSVIGKIDILEDGQIQVRQDTVILEDGVEVSRTYHRCVLVPGSDIEDHDDRIRAVCKAVWTPSVVKAYRASLTKEVTP